MDAADTTHRSLFWKPSCFCFFHNPNFYAAYNPKGAADIPRRCFLLKCSHTHPAHISAAPFATVASGPPPRTVFCLIWGCPQWAQHALFSLFSLSLSFISFHPCSRLRGFPSFVACSGRVSPPHRPSRSRHCTRSSVCALNSVGHPPFSSLLFSPLPVLSPRLHDDETTSRSNQNRSKTHEKPPPRTRPRPHSFCRSFLRRSLATAR